MEDTFVYLCCEGKLDELKEMYQTYNINIHINHDSAFRCSCYNGHLNIAQWLYSLGGVNIHAITEEAFVYSCINGRLNVAQWLYSLGGINIHANNDHTFEWCCYKGHLNVVQWLLSIDKFNNELVDIHLLTELYEYAFSLGYYPTNKMIPAYIEYKNKIRNEIIEKHENGNIGVFELSYLVDIILVYV